VAEKVIANATILAIIADEDWAPLGKLFAGSSWKLVFASNLPETQTALRRTPPGVVICDGRLSDGHSWKDLLHEIRRMEDPPPLIVADRLADDRLWAEALNLGAHDLLAKPFDGREVWHAVTTACRRRENENGGSRRRISTERPKDSGKRAVGIPG
jgi:DNA-binding response OmpR family regulator